jgi:shikimate kinase
MSKLLILINGFGGSGKTAVGRALLAALPSSALLDFDSLTCVNPFEWNEQLLKLGHKNSAALTKNFLRENYQHIIVCGGCNTQRHLDNFLSHLPEHPEVLWFFLVASVEERRRRKLLRSRDDSDNPEWFEFLEAKEGLYEGPLRGTRVRSIEVETDERNIGQVMVELKVAIKQNVR